MNHIVSASLLLLTGICIYAAINHAFISIQRPFSRVHFLFSLFCITLVGFEFTHLLTYRATSIPELITSLKWELSSILLMLGVFPWFIYEYSRIGPRWLVIGLSIFFFFSLFINNVEPFSLQYLNIERIEQIHLPWGETLTRPVGQNGVVYYIGALLALVSMGYGFYALLIRYYRDRTWTCLCMFLAVGLFLITGTEGMLVRMSVIHFIHLGPFGILAMVIVMSMALSQEVQQKVYTTENRFRSLVEQSPFSIQMLSPDGHTLSVNLAWQKLWGVNEDQIRNYNLLQDPQLREKGITPYLEQGFAGYATEIPPIIYNPAENDAFKGPFNTRWVRAYIYPIKDEKNAVREVVLLHEDITEKKQFEDAIHFIATGTTEIGEGYFRQLVKHLSELFNTRYAFLGEVNENNQTEITTIAVSKDGKIVPNFKYSLVGTPCANVVGKRTCIYPSNVQEQFPEDHLLSDMGVEGYMGTPLFDVDGNPCGIIVLLDERPLNNTENMKAVMEIIAVRTSAELERVKADDLLQKQRRHLQEMVDIRTAELQATMKELEAFSYSVSHDLRAPLRSIDGFCQAIMREYYAKLDDVGKDFLDRIRNNTQRMAVLIDNLMELSRINRKDIVKQPVNITNLVLETINKIRDEDVGREVKTTVMPDIIVQGDHDLLAIAVDNLVSNAWKYTKNTKNPEIEFGITQIEGKRSCFIKDNGIGFDMKDAEKIFVAFQRLQSNEQFEGTGIGLATVFRIIQRHHGNVWAEAKPNEGATFYFSLPEENSKVAE